MTAHALAARLGLRLDPHGDAGQLRAITSTGVAVLLLTPRPIVGGGVSWRVESCLDLAALERGRAA